jgi:hypothetical protein
MSTETEFDNPSSAQLRVAGDVNLEKVQITSLANNTFFDIKNQVITLQIFEDIFSPFITGSLIVKDSLDLINSLPFTGQEYLDLRVYTPTLDQSLKSDGVIDQRFYIYKLTEREYFGEKAVGYQIHFITADAVTDLNVAPSKAFSGKVSEIVAKIVKDTAYLNSDKQLILEDTKNSIKFISNFWPPTKSIKYATEHAQNPNNSSTYLFFENRKGYNFVSLDYLNDQPVYQTFKSGTTHDDINKLGGSTRVLQRDFSKILELSVPNGFDYIDRVRHGTYASKLVTHDFTTKRYGTVFYDYLKKFGEGKETRLNQFPITTDEVAARVGAITFTIEKENQVFTGFGEIGVAKVLQDRISRMKQAESFKLSLRVKGRSDYTVGQKVYLDVNIPAPTATADTPNDYKDKMYSGNYLISAINHVIDREQHECFIEVIKDSLIFDLKTGKTAA